VTAVALGYTWDEWVLFVIFFVLVVVAGGIYRDDDRWP
jgi:hypothetical protein